MKREAVERLEALTAQFEELKKNKMLLEKESSSAARDENSPKTAATTRAVSSSLLDEVPTATELSREVREKDLPRLIEDLEPTKMTATGLSSPTREDKSATTSAAEERAEVAAAPQPRPAPLDLLADTRWKIVFNVGREQGTWMPPDWGASGDRLLLQVTVDFTDGALPHDRDEFFQGPAGCRVLRVVEGHLVPRGVGTASVGQRPLPVRRLGGYKVCPGQGPLGTDIVRMFVELERDVHMPDHVSDVYCPAGRIYGTCGYWPIPLRHPADEMSGRSWRDIRTQEHQEAVLRYEQLQQTLDNDTRMFSWDQLKLMKDVALAKRRVNECAKKLREARQRDPEKSQLRLSRREDVGLSREGGVCCKVRKGLTLEYHILGRMEVGCVDDHHHKEEEPDTAVHANDDHP
jgi:hypothetical protein